MATGIASSGAGVGIVLISLGTNYIDNSYGWKGYVIFISLLSPICGVLGALAILRGNTCTTELQPLNKNNHNKTIKNDAGISR